MTAVKPGDRVVLHGCTGTVVAITKPYTKVETRGVYRNGRWRTVNAANPGDRLAKVRWDDLMATNRWKTWINTRSLQVVAS